MESGRDGNEYRSCKRKKAYDTEADVVAVRAYLCRFCGKWHGASFGFEKFMEFNEANLRKRRRADRYARRKRKRVVRADE